MEVTAAQVLAFRLAAQGLAQPAGSRDEVLSTWTVQDSPPGAGAAAVANRTDALEPGALDAAVYEDRSVVALYNARSATALVPAGEAAVYAAPMDPGEDDAGLKAIAASSVPEQKDGYAEPIALAVEAISEALDGTVRSRDDLHEELRRRLPDALLPWCPGCTSHHAKRGLLIMASLRGRLCIAGRAGRQPAFARTDQWVGWNPPADPGPDLVERYLAAYGPSTRQHFAHWAGLGTAHAKALWERVDTVEVAVDGESAALLERDVAALADPPAATGVRLIAPGDPLLIGRDREALIADDAARRKVFAATGGAGVVLADGRVAGIWRGRKQGTRLAVAVEPLGRRVEQAALEAAATRLAPHRGCAEAAVSVS